MENRFRASAVVVLCVSVLAGCATRLPIVTDPRYPSYPFPTVPDDLAGTDAVVEHERAWLFLQFGDLEEAERRFISVLRTSPEFDPSIAGLGFIDLAMGKVDKAVSHFDQLLARRPAYLPALLGRGEAFLLAGDVDAAVENFRAALLLSPGLLSLRRRMEELRFVSLMDEVAEARAASNDGRYIEAKAAYERLISESPNSGFLYIELAEVDHHQGDLDSALGRLERGVELDPTAVAAWILMAEIYLARDDIDRAEQALLRADTVEPREEITLLLEDLAARRRRMNLPLEFREIGESEAITRGQLAALIGLQFETLLVGAEDRITEIITDTRDHWGYQWVIAVTRAGVMDSDTNYRFQPEGEVTRAELAQVVVRLLRLAFGETMSPSGPGRISFSDLGPGHLSYPSASEAVDAGILEPLEENTFQPGRPLSGSDAVTALDRLGDLLEVRR